MGIKITPNDSLRDNLEHQLRIAPQLENFVATSMVGPQESTAIDPRKASIFMALADKSFTTFNAIVILLQKGLYEDAAALVRILYESTMTATFLLYANEQEVDDYADFFMFRNWRDHQLAEEVNPIAASAFLPQASTKWRSSSIRSGAVTARASGHRVRQKKWQKSRIANYQKGSRSSPCSMPLSIVNAAHTSTPMFAPSKTEFRRLLKD